ncbi:MAG: hypothetical protein AB8B56_07120 [Crocinitomicaceae bacterium]
MKRLLTHLYVLPIFLFVLAACGDGENPEENNNAGPSEEVAENADDSEAEESETKGPFGIKSGVIEYEDRSIGGEVRANLKLYFTNYGALTKLEETTDGEMSVYIYNDATKKGVTQFGQRKPSKIFMRQGELNLFLAPRGTNGFAQQEDEMILGKTCEVQANNATSADGDPQVIFWLHKGIPMKEINRLGMGYEFEAVKLEEKAVDKSQFSLADAEMPHDIF